MTVSSGGLRDCSKRMGWDVIRLGVYKRMVAGCVQFMAGGTRVKLKVSEDWRSLFLMQ